MKTKYQKPESRVLEMEMESHIMDFTSQNSANIGGETDHFEIRRRHSFYYDDEEEW